MISSFFNVVFPLTKNDSLTYLFSRNRMSENMKNIFLKVIFRETNITLVKINFNKSSVYLVFRIDTMNGSDGGPW